MTMARAQSVRPPFFNSKLGMWVVSSYRDVLAVLQDPSGFSSAQAYADMAGFLGLAPEAVAAIEEVLPLSTLHPANSDPPEHLRLRSSVERAFSVRNIKRLEPIVHEITDSLIDGFVADGRVDLMKRFVAQLPALSILRFIGVPAEDADRVKVWYRDWARLVLTPAAASEQVILARSLSDFHRYLAELLARRRRNPQQDLLSDLAVGKADLSDAEIINLASQLIAAGTETTMFALGICFLRLLHDRQKWRAIVESPVSIPAVVEEALRCNQAQRGLLRIATHEATLAGVNIPAGARIYVLHTAANRDPDIFEKPELFDPERLELKRHVAFGRGIHTCLGAALARLEMRVALTKASVRIPDLALSSTHALGVMKSPLVTTIERLWVEWTPA